MPPDPPSALALCLVFLYLYPYNPCDVGIVREPPIVYGAVFLLLFTAFANAIRIGLAQGYFEVIKPHTEGSLTIPRASTKWV